MAVNAWIHGYATRKGEKHGAFAVRITDGDAVLSRSYKLKGATANQAEMRAAQFVLRSINHPQASGDVVIHTCSHYLTSLLEKGDDGAWLKDPKANQGVVEELRSDADRFNLQIVKDSDSPEMAAMKRTARNRASV